MQTMRKPEKGEVQIVVLLRTTKFVGWAQRADVDGIMDAFERRANITADERDDQAVHASVRMEVTRLLRGDRAEELFTDRLAAASLWLALRHWSNGTDMRAGLDAQMAAADCAIVTASIADPAPEGTMDGTAWAFMIGDRVHDGRPQLEGRPSGLVTVFRRKDAA